MQKSTKSKPFNSHEFKKSLGQNFISDKNLLTAIVGDAEISSTDMVVEIGAGAGTLTEVIASKCKKLISFEVDESLKEDLAKIEDEHKNLKVVFKDFLKVERDELLQLFEDGENVKSIKVIANIPYYITTPIVFKLLNWCSLVKDISIMVQKEVGERMVSVPNSKTYGALSAVVNYYGKATIKRVVKKQNFYPMPKVDSCIVNIKVRENIDENYAIGVSKFIQSCFFNRRKTLCNNLMSALSITRESAESALNQLSLSTKVRAEELPSEQFELLYKVLSGFKLNKFLS